jgi:hypothetical protein
MVKSVRFVLCICIGSLFANVKSAGVSRLDEPCIAARRKRELWEMAGITDSLATGAFRPVESERDVGAFVDRWIFVFMAGFFIVITLVGFVPDSLDKVSAIQAGKRPQFPMILHAHAVLMGAFMLLLFTQTWLAATGRKGLHMHSGMLAFALVPALVVVGFLLVPVSYDELVAMWQAAPPEGKAKAEELVLRRENVLLAQSRIGLLFSIYISIALWARRRDSGLHKRMMLLGTAIALPPAITRTQWLPTTMPDSYLAVEMYILLAISPMLLWDIVRNRSIHRAYWIWLGIALPVVATLHLLWDTPWWHATARQMLAS